MDANQINTFLSVAGGLVAALGGWEFIKYMLNRRNNERINAAKAFQTEYETVMSEYKRMQFEVNDLKKQVSKLHNEIDELKDDRLRLKEENSQLKIQLKEAEKHICWRPKDECFQRLIESDDCLYRKIIRGIKEKHPNAIVTEEDMKKPLTEKADEDNGVPEDADKG